MNPEEIVEKHTLLLEKFIEKLLNDGLSKKTIKTHLNNVDLFVNHYLAYYWDDEINKLDIVDLMEAIEEYFSYWYIRKILFSSVSNMKSSITSIKKFFKFLLEINYIDKFTYDLLIDTIKDEKDEWLLEMKRYDEDDEMDY